jgi:DNA-binding NarL/FixJ family response regulator
MSGSVRLLVADDSSAFLDATIDVVEATEGFELVGTATSGEAAVALAASTLPDLVLIDVRMPGLGGIAAATRIREQQPATLVVMVTADSGTALARSAAFPVLDKRSLSPSTLAEVWENREFRPHS